MIIPKCWGIIKDHKARRPELEPARFLALATFLTACLATAMCGGYYYIIRPVSEMADAGGRQTRRVRADWPSEPPQPPAWEAHATPEQKRRWAANSHAYVENRFVMKKAALERLKIYDARFKTPSDPNADVSRVTQAFFKLDKYEKREVITAAEKIKADGFARLNSRQIDILLKAGAFATVRAGLIESATTDPLFDDLNKIGRRKDVPDLLALAFGRLSQHQRAEAVRLAIKARDGGLDRLISLDRRTLEDAGFLDFLDW